MTLARKAKRLVRTGGAAVLELGFSVRCQKGVSEVEFLISPGPKNTTLSDAPPRLIRWLFIQKFNALIDPMTHFKQQGCRGA